MALLGTAGAAAGVLPVQYGGPMMGGPMMGDPYGGPPDFDPRLGPGPDGQTPYGPGPGYGGMRRPRRLRSAGGPFRSYHGFRIDLAGARGSMDGSSALAAIEHQIDIVDRSGVGPSMLAQFRAVPIRMSTSSGGSHYSGGSEVALGALQPDDDRPVLLHEYMHVLEYRSFPGGFHNATVGRFFEQARAEGLYPPDSYMMSNPAEFWAVTASCYLNGTVAREPFTREALRARQPAYYAYLSRLFGPRGDRARTDGSKMATAP